MRLSRSTETRKQALKQLINKVLFEGLLNGFHAVNCGKCAREID